jgi:ankyrin repeat protein
MRKLLIILTILLTLAGCSKKEENDCDKLLSAVKNGEVKLLNKIIDQGCDLNAKGSYGITALIWAAEKGHYDITKILLENGARVNDTSDNGVTPLINAAFKGSYKIVELLISHGADVTITAGDGGTAISAAKASKSDDALAIISILKEAGAKE